MSHLQFTRKNVTIGLITIVLVFFLAPTVIREGLAALIEIRYKSDIEKAYVSSFPALDDKLKAMGVAFAPSQRYEKTNCDNGPFSVSSPCSKERVSNPITPTDSFIQNWAKNAPELDRYLQEHGWQNQSSAGFAQLFDPGGRESQTVLVYLITSHGAACSLQADYEHYYLDLNNQNYYTKLDISEFCSKKGTRSPSTWW